MNAAGRVDAVQPLVGRRAFDVDDVGFDGDQIDRGGADFDITAEQLVAFVDDVQMSIKTGQRLDG